MDYLSKLQTMVHTYKIKQQLYSLIKKDFDLLHWIKNQVPLAESLPEQIYCIIHNLQPFCPNNNRMTFKDSWKGYMLCGREQCACWKDNQSKKVSEAKKNMTEHEWKEVLAKRKETNLIKYGTEAATQNQTVKDNIAKSNIQKYGVKTTLLSPDTQEKIKKTLQTNYGVDHPSKNKEIKNKAMNTCLEKYGHVVYPHSTEGRERVKQSLKDRYNVTSISQIHFSQEVRDLLQNDDVLIKSFEQYGIHGLLAKYPELTYKTLRDNLVKIGIVFDKKLTKPEMFINDFLTTHSIEFEYRTRKIIPPFELDFYIPNQKLAIEVCGLFWHKHSSLQDKNYHVKKLERCLEKGIQLITIFSDQIENSPNIVSHRLSAKLHILPRKYHARKLKIELCGPSNEIRKFLNKQHIQGSKLGKYNIIAINDDNEICAAMTFGELRKSLGQKTKKENVWEMYRFSSNGNIPGVASRLLKKFINEIHPEQIISYSDRCWGEGNLYQILNFQFIHKTQPNYWYTKDFISRIHRFTFAKHKLVQQGCDPSLTEFEIMDSRGYSRFYDCGSIKYEWVAK